MKKQQVQWVLLTLGLAVSVGCTVPFLVNPGKDTTKTGAQVVNDPGQAAATLPIFLPQPGANQQPLVLPPVGLTPGLGINASGNPAITGPLPSPSATPFLPNLAPNIDNQISFNPLPVIQASGNLTATQPIVKSIIKGRVLGWNPATEKFEALANAQVRIDSGLSLSTDANGFYTTSQEFDKVVSISAGSEGYVASTVTDVPPGISRDIHLNPLNERTLYRQDVYNVTGAVTNLGQTGKRPVVVFADGNNSVASASSMDNSGRYSLDIRMKATRSTTTGTLFAGVFEDVGKLSAVTQYGYSPNVQVPVPPAQPVPTPTPNVGSNTAKALPIKPTELLLSFDHLTSPEAFGQIIVNITADSSSNLQGSVMHVYMNLPDGGRVLVANYNDNTSTTINQTIRLPKVTNTSFTVVAHSGSAQRGSDIVIPNLQLGSSVSRTFMPPPAFNQIGNETDFSNPNKTRFSSAALTPQIRWGSMAGVNSYQLDLQGEFPETFRWEAYTLGTSLTYPDFGADHPLSLKLGKTYRLQLLASDFDIGTFNILSEGPMSWREPSRAEKVYDKLADGSFGIKLLNPTIRNFSQGYRVSYNSLSFLTD